MKKIIYVLAAFALMIGMSSCQKEEFKSDSESLVVTAALDNGAATRVSYAEVATPKAGLKGTWAKNSDKIYGLWKAAGSSTWNKVTFNCTDEKDGVGIFSVADGSSTPTDGATVNVVYAGSRAVNISTSSGYNQYKATLSFENQVGTLATVGNNVVLWATATVSGNNLHFDFQPASSVLKMNLKLASYTSSNRYVYLLNVSNSITVNFSKNSFSEAITFSSATPSQQYPSTTARINLTETGAQTLTNNASRAFYAVIPANQGTGSDYGKLQIRACKQDKTDKTDTYVGRTGDKKNFVAGQFNEMTSTSLKTN